MEIAYAAFASNLTITGTSSTTNNWGVRIVSITPDKNAGGTSPNYTSSGSISAQKIDDLSHTSDCYSNSSTHNWLSNSFIGNEWTLSPYSSSDANHVWYVYPGGSGGMYAKSYNGGRPVFHLSSNVALTGNGTNDANVYRIQ